MAGTALRPIPWAWFVAWGAFSVLAFPVMKGLLGLRFWPQVGIYWILLMLFMFVLFRAHRSSP